MAFYLYLNIFALRVCIVLIAITEFCHFALASGVAGARTDAAQRS